MPTLLISGEHDESTPAINRALQREIPGARWVLMEGCSHLAHVEASESYLRAVQEFLDSSWYGMFIGRRPLRTV